MMTFYDFEHWSSLNLCRSRFLRKIPYHKNILYKWITYKFHEPFCTDNTLNKIPETGIEICSIFTNTLKPAETVLK